MVKNLQGSSLIAVLTLAAASFTGGISCALSQTSRVAMSTAVVAEDSILKQDSFAALEHLYADQPRAKEIAERSKAILVFPNLTEAGFLTGVQGGDGLLIEDGKVTGIYNNTMLSGYVAEEGVQSFAEVMFFTNSAALNNLRSTKEWPSGSGQTIVLMDEHMAKTMTTTTLKNDVYAFIFGRQGLMAGRGLQTQKITRIKG